MNVFVIPSWYPHRCYPWEGIFLQEQARAIAEARPDWNVGLCLWGQGEGFVSSAHFKHSPGCVLEALGTRPFERALGDNLVEFMQPCLWWPERVWGGNKQGLLKACRANLKRAIRRFGSIDVIHAHVAYPAGWIAMQLAEEFQLPFVITEHQGPFPLPVYTSPDGNLKAILREPLQRADARIAVSPTLANTLGSYGIQDVTFIPNLIDERQYPLTPTRASDDFVFYTLCAMERGKGVGDLVKAARKFIDRLDDPDRERLRFVMAGAGSALESFQAEVAMLGLTSFFEWRGAVSRDQARHGFRECDAFVLTSWHESFGIVYVEANAVGRPVIATRCGGPESIVSIENGLLVDVSDLDQIADALHFMFMNAKNYDPALIRASCLQQFGRDAVVGHIEEVYRSVLHRRGGQRRAANA
jgi:glycosyltransferase involved in cell wall biosynthesis